jgi:hypothetical protein
MPNNLPESNQEDKKTSFFKSLPKPQRNAFLFLSFLSFAILILWAWQLNFRLSSPFAVPNGENISIDEAASDFQTLLTDRDTDGDGLTDDEEINLYNTSPYLADTDGDGVSDREEIERGTDPLCAPGGECDSDRTIAVPSLSPSLNIGEELLDVPGFSNETDDILEAMLTGQADANQLRILLSESGADASLLEQLSDEDLLTAYQEMLAEKELEQ